MTKNILNIVPYIATHGKIILASQMNHVLMDKDAQFDGDAMELEQNGLAYTCMINNEPIASAGMKIIWDGVAEVFALKSLNCDLLFGNPIAVIQSCTVI